MLLLPPHHNLSSLGTQGPLPLQVPTSLSTQHLIQCFGGDSTPQGGSKAASGVTGVSAFAFQGTNAHALLLPPPATPPALGHNSEQNRDASPASKSPRRPTAPAAHAAPLQQLRWQRHRVWATPPVTLLLSEARLAGSGSGKQAAFVAQLGQPGLACLWHNVLGGNTIAPTALLLELASAALATLLHNPLSITPAAAGPTPALANLVLPAACVLPRCQPPPAAAALGATELLCVCQQAGLLEVRTPAGAVHLRAHGAALVQHAPAAHEGGDCGGSRGPAGGAQPARSAAKVMLQALVTHGTSLQLCSSRGNCSSGGSSLDSADAVSGGGDSNGNGRSRRGSGSGHSFVRVGSSGSADVGPCASNSHDSAADPTDSAHAMQAGSSVRAAQLSSATSGGCAGAGKQPALQAAGAACVTASINPSSAAHHGRSCGCSCIQDAGTDGRLVSVLEFEGALQAGAIARHAQLLVAAAAQTLQQQEAREEEEEEEEKKEQRGQSKAMPAKPALPTAPSSGVLSSMGAYLAPAWALSSGHDGGRWAHKQLSAVAVPPPSPTLPPGPATAPRPGGGAGGGAVAVVLQCGQGGPHRAQQVGYHIGANSGPAAAYAAAAQEEPDLTAAAAPDAGMGPAAQVGAVPAADADAGPHPLLEMDAEARVMHLQVRSVGEQTHLGRGFRAGQVRTDPKGSVRPSHYPIAPLFKVVFRSIFRLFFRSVLGPL